MKTKVITLLLICVILSSCFIFAACDFLGNPENTDKNESMQYQIYTMAAKSGFDGTYEEWLDSIKGANGNQVQIDIVNNNLVWKYDDETQWRILCDMSTLVGPQGEQGIQGEQGPQGEQGIQGKSAYEIYKEHHPDYNKTEAEWIEELVSGALVSSQKHTVTFDTKGGSTIDPIQVEHLHEIPYPTNPVRPGYLFNGWVTKSGQPWAFEGLVVSSDITLNALWLKDDTYVAPNEILMYTSTEFVPFEYVYDSKIIGLDVAIISEVAERLNKKLTIRDVPFDSIISDLDKHNSGLVVGAAGIVITPDREEKGTFSNIYFTEGTTMVSKNLPLTSLQDFDNKTVAVEQGSYEASILNQACSQEGYNGIKLNNTNILYCTSVHDIKMDMVSNSVDAALIYSGYESTFYEYNRLKLEGTREEKMGMMFKKGQDQNFINLVNTVIQEWTANGNIKKYHEYYTKLYLFASGKGEKPNANGLKLTWNC